MKFPGVSYEYCDEVNEFLDYVHEMYNTAEVHSINTSKGDTADVRIFSDNATMTIYEFLEAAEMEYLGWGNSTQKANRMYNKHLSEEIKNKLINMSDSYPEMKRWLIANYGGMSRIVSDIVNDLSRRAKPNPNNSTQRFSFYASISGALQRMVRLSKVGEINKQGLENSQATLSSLSLVLPNDAYADWITEMTRAGLDYKNPVGEAAYRVFKNLCIIERNKSEGSRESERANGTRSPGGTRSPRSPRIKAKSAHKVSEIEDGKSGDEMNSCAFATKFNPTKWYRADLKFPCPLLNHQHEMSTCAEFFFH